MQFFDRDEYSFKKLKEEYSEEELAQIKASFKDVWQTWKKLNLSVYLKLPQDKFAKVHVESWINGWNFARSLLGSLSFKYFG